MDEVIRKAPEVVERVQGRCGELVLRRVDDDLEIILNGAFLISTANEASSRAMIAAALPYLRRDELRILIGGLGLGYALDEALDCPSVAEVTVVELEPTIVRWFWEVSGRRAERAAAGERAGRVELAIRDVAEAIAAAPGTYDLISLDTDNGPEWLVRDENAGLYSDHGVALVRRALRGGGVAVFWSPDRYPAFRDRLAHRFERVVESVAHDVVDGRRHEYVMYVGLRDEDPSPRATSGRVDWQRTEREAR